MAVLRPDLDGLRLSEPGTPDVWLVFNGERHRITSAEAAAALFQEPEQTVRYFGVDLIQTGVDIGEECCLVTPEGLFDIYFVTPMPDNAIQKHRIQSWDSFCDFGFDQDRVRPVPALLLEGLRQGSDLASAKDRNSR